MRVWVEEVGPVFELLGQSQIADIPTVIVDGKEKYRRLIIQRVDHPNSELVLGEWLTT